MNSQPPLNRDLMIPILLGGLSIVGILVVLLIGRALNSPGEIPMTPSPTLFRYIYLGTEPAIATPFVEGSDIPQPTDETPIVETPVNFPTLFPTPTRSPLVPPPLILNTATSTSIFRTSTPSRTPTATLGTATIANTYDDTDSRLLYSGTWVSQTSVTGAYQGTLHISNTIGDAVTFSFTGDEIFLYYQAGPSLGAITITIDGLGAPALSQAQSQTEIRQWVSGLLPAVTHSIVIGHYSGGSINIDSLVVPAPTPTPTRTSTPIP
jgi:hypothetical protein